MPETGAKVVNRVAVEVSSDLMEAWISVSTGEGHRLPDPEEVQAASEDVEAVPEEVQAASEDVQAESDDVQALLKEVRVALEEKGILIAGYAAERIEELRILMEDDNGQVERFSIAKGQLPVDGIDADFTWHESLDLPEHDWRGDAAIDYYTLNSMVTVEQDIPIGTITRAIPGIDGVDVCGSILKPGHTAREVQVDKTVRLEDDDSLTVFSNIAGRVIYADHMLAIDEVITIRGDVEGTVRALFAVKSEKSITVGGAIESAEVKAKCDIAVRGGILGRAKRAAEAEGMITAKFCAGADLRAMGDIEIAKEAINSHIRSESKLLVGRGSIIGGEVYGREGVEAATLGSSANVPTSITVGIHPEVLREAAAIDAELRAKLQAGDRAYQAVRPLLAELKRLTPRQREQAMELLSKVRSLATEIQEAQTSRDDIIEAGRAIGMPYVLASHVLFQGVSIRIGRRCTLFRDDRKGPIRIEEQTIEGVTELVAINVLSGAVEVLESREVVEEEHAPAPQEGQEIQESSGQNGHHHHRQELPAPQPSSPEQELQGSDR